jgi:hypothetical protein
MCIRCCPCETRFALTPRPRDCAHAAPGAYESSASSSLPSCAFILRRVARAERAYSGSFRPTRNFC